MKVYRNIIAAIFGITLLASCNRTTQSIDPLIYRNQIMEHRSSYIQDFIKDPNAPLDSLGIQYLKFYEPDPTYVCLCDYIKLDKPQGFEMATYAGTVQSYLVYAKARCKLNKVPFTLEIYKNTRYLAHPVYKNRGFIPFRDHTNGSETYGGGRYLNLALDSVKGTVLIDFNKAYNPYCAYKEGYACPIPPIANHLDFAVAAGEMVYEKD